MSNIAKQQPREGLVEVHRTKGNPNPVFVVTGLGLAHIQQMAAIGSNRAEIARYLRVSDTWLMTKLDEDGDLFDEAIAEAFAEGQSEFSTRLRTAQANLADTNAQMAIHLGKQYLGQRDDAVEHRHVHQVVGTMPDYDQSSAEWRRQFAPDTVQKIGQEIEDAEFVDIEETDNA